MSFPSQFVAELSAEDSRSVLFWSAILIALIFVLFFAYAQLKRWMKEPEESTPLGFTLGDLREMHRRGEMTDEEFETAKVKMLASAKKMTDSLPNVLGPGRTANPRTTKPEETS